MQTKKRSLLRSGIITSASTFLSRILGMLRDVAIAQLLGASVLADVFFFANRIPNFLRRLFAEGAFAQAFVPVFTEYKKNRSHPELLDLLAKTKGTLGAIVLVISILGMLASPIITALFGYGWYKDYLAQAPDGFKFTEASQLLRITFPYLFFITLTALYSSILNTYGSFAIPAITPCLLNISLIIGAYFIGPYFSDPNKILAYSMLAGGVAQFLFQLPFIFKLKLFVWPKFSWNNPGVKKIRTLMIPALFGVSASQLNLMINTILASFLASGSISYLYYSDRLLEFPIGIFAVAISTVILPTLSAINIKTDHDKYQNTLDWGIRLVLFLAIPSALGIIVLRELILRVLFMRGAFTQENVLLSSNSLLASVSGLGAIMLVRVLVQGFAAIQDTKTPVKCSISSIFSNIAFNLILIYPLGYVGLALSTALAAFVNAFLLLFLLHKKQIYKISKKSLIFILKVLISSIIMAFILRYIQHDLSFYASLSTFHAALYLLMYLMLGLIIILGLLFIMGVRFKDFVHTGTFIK